MNHSNKRQNGQTTKWQYYAIYITACKPGPYVVWGYICKWWSHKQKQTPDDTKYRVVFTSEKGRYLKIFFKCNDLRERLICCSTYSKRFLSWWGIDCKGMDNIQIPTLGAENTSVEFIVIFSLCIYVISTFLHMLNYIIKIWKNTGF